MWPPGGLNLATFGNDGRADEDPQVDNKPVAFGKVRLFNGADVAAVEVLLTLGKLKDLQSQSLRGQILLGELHRICDGGGNGNVDDAAVQALIGKSLLARDGGVAPEVRQIVRAAVQRKPGMSNVWEVRDPYPGTDANEAAITRAASKAFRDLGLGDLLVLPDSPRFVGPEKAPEDEP